MVQRPQAPDADRQEQLDPAGGETPADPLEEIVTRVEAPEADVIEQHTPAGRQPEFVRPPTSTRIPLSHIPEADALDQALPADHELFEDDE